MKTETVSTRRRFLCKAGAALSAPLAIVGATVSPGLAEHRSPLEARLAALEDANAIRGLHRTYARHVARGAHDEVARLFERASDAETDPKIRGLSTDGFGEDDVIELAPDLRSATGRFHCTVQTETAIGPSCTLVEMARAQGEGFVRGSERRVIEAAYVKQDGVWKIRTADYRPL